MLLEIDYTTNIIVGVIYNNKFNWYLTDKSLWYLNGNKLTEAYRRKGFQCADYFDDEFRVGLDILDQNNANIFLDRIDRFKITASELNHFMLQQSTVGNDDWLFNFRPSLYVNFDKREFYSLYSEPASFEYYVPANWYSTYNDFTNLIPKKERYWLDKDFKNMLY